MFELVCIERRLDYKNSSTWSEYFPTHDEAKDAYRANKNLTDQYNEHNGQVSFLTMLIVDEQADDVHSVGPIFYDLP